MNISDYFYYCETSASCLRRARDWRNGPKHSKLVQPVGSEAGTLDKDGYYIVNINGRRYRAHRLVWEIHNGQIPEGMSIDHMDGRRTNNKISNLRIATPSLNNRNRTVGLENESGLRGVCKHVKNVNGKSYDYWNATWWSGGKHHAKCFSIAKLGNEEALRKAIQHRLKMIEILNNQGAGYSDRHVRGD